MSVNLSYALAPDGSVIHISEAQRGSSCDCVCPACGDKLIAKKGSEKIHHFAHMSGNDCTSGFRASLCYAAKRIIDRASRLYMPAYIKNCTIADEGSGMVVIIPEDSIPIEKVDITRKKGDITGLTAYCSGRPLLIRLLTSYSTGASRNIQKIAQVGIPMIEIDLSHDESFDDNLLSAYILKPSDASYWIYNAKAKQIWENMESKCSRLPVKGEQNAIYTYGCQVPEKRSDGFKCYIKDKCSKCEFFFGLYGYQEDRYILCGRQNVITEPDDLRLSIADRKRKYGIRF